MMPFSMVEKVVYVILALLIVGALGQAFIDFVLPASIEQQRVELQSAVDLYQRLGLLGGAR